MIKNDICEDFNYSHRQEENCKVTVLMEILNTFIALHVSADIGALQLSYFKFI